TTHAHDVIVIDPGALPEPEKNRLTPLLGGAERLVEVRLAGSGDVPRDVARVRETPLAGERVRGKTEAEVGLAAPVSEVVAADVAEVADLVLPEARGVEPLDGLDVQRRDFIVLGQRHAPACDLPRQRRPFPEVEHVER